MITTNAMLSHTDADLVSGSLTGDRDAFGQIVGRYQSLICSLAYSATGNLSQSEDLAQETFVTAWKKLGELREPAKLRAWLCGIARNLINNWLRRQGREPSHAAESLENLPESPAPEPLPLDHTISNEEAAILWRSLERIPEVYREPLVLFYREQQSVESVATSLDLTEDAVKQRLSRGRKLLHEEVLSFVEGALTRTNPGRAFTVGVLAALPLFTVSAQAAVIGATAVKGTATAKSAGIMGILGAFLGPLMGFFGTWLGYKMSMASARTERERQYYRKFYIKLAVCIIGFGAVFTALMMNARRLAGDHLPLLVCLIIGLAVAYGAAIIILVVWSFREQRRLLAEQPADPPSAPDRPAWEYRSRMELMGWPLVHMRIGGGMKAQRNVVKAWIAVGDCAIGRLFAFGGLAIAPISLGGCAVGLLPWGGAALGLFPLGGIAAGVWACGGLALGWQALAGCALAWNAAMGGVALANDFALGGLARAAQANNEIAAQYMQPLPFFYYGQMIMRQMMWLNLLWLVPLIGWWWVILRDARKRGANPHAGAAGAS